MNHVILTISGININNEELVFDMIGDAGYAGSHNWVNDTCITLDIGSEDFRQKAGIKEIEVATMIGSLIMYTSVKVQSQRAEG